LDLTVKIGEFDQAGEILKVLTREVGTGELLPDRKSDSRNDQGGTKKEGFFFFAVLLS